MLFKKSKFHGQIFAKSQIVEIRNFQDTFETRKRSFIRAFSICMTVPLNHQPAKYGSLQPCGTKDIIKVGRMVNRYDYLTTKCDSSDS